MMSYENITQASTPSGRSQSVTHEKENTKQSNANFISEYVAKKRKIVIIVIIIKKIK